MKNSVKIVMNKKKHNLSNHPFSCAGHYIYIRKYITESLHGDGVKIYIHIVQSLLKNHL